MELIGAGHTPIIIDNLSNSSVKSIERIEQITGVKPKFYQADVRDQAALENIFEENDIDAAIHFAGLKAVGESVEKPLWYYQNNLDSTLVLLEVMQKHNVKKLVFSSSATVYGDPTKLPLTEDMPLSATNPYGQTKLMIEQILKDVNQTKTGWNITSLRYFNPIGAHPSGLIGEDPAGIPNNLLPYIAQVAVGKRQELSVFGDDYDTVDGTGVRDYIHVVDLAQAHLAALEHLDHADEYKAYNISTGRGTSVLELVKAFESASGVNIPYKIVDRRPGDIASSYSSTELTERELGWKSKLSIKDSCRDTWKWQSENPNGYSG
ncbi:UDP-glucose 4-epimerase GalE [Candidatus Saccharibacteria bacterium]|nr:MAG: UDP-glucose 4-epimerase GalE [Candidatus Saccharibacteria bacterium]